MNIQENVLEELKEEVLKSIEGKSDDEKIEILRKKYNINWDIPRYGDYRPCKTWYAQVFTYCSTNELERELNFSKLAIGIPSTNQKIHTDRPPLNCRVYQQKIA